MPLSPGEPVDATMRAWRPEEFDLLMDCLVQILAPLRAGALVFHGSAVLREGVAYVFTAPRETGKTTVARYSRDLGYTVLAEEMAYVGWDATGANPVVCSLPLLEKNRMGVTDRTQVPLAGIYRLRQAAEDRVEVLTQAQRILELSRVAAVAVRASVVAMAALDVAARLASRGEPKRLHFTRSARFWQVIDADEERA